MATKKVSGNKGSTTPKPSTSSKKPSKSTSKKGKDEPDDTVAIDLTNPDDLLQKWEQLDINDEEADELLKRAYEVNRELKKQLELGRKVMDKQMTASAKGSMYGHHRRPGSNMVNVNTTPGHPSHRQQTRMASASHSAGSRKKTPSGSGIPHPMQSYSYHSYTDRHAGKY